MNEKQAATATRFRAAVEARDLDTIAELFAEDVRFYSPVKFSPFEGKSMVVGLFGVLLRTFGEFRYVGALDGEVETAAGEETESHILVFRATVNDAKIHGIDLIQFGADGLITEFTVMVRPLSALNALSEAVFAGLVADGLVS